MVFAARADLQMVLSPARKVRRFATWVNLALDSSGLGLVFLSSAVPLQRRYPCLFSLLFILRASSSSWKALHLGFFLSPPATPFPFLVIFLSRPRKASFPFFVRALRERDPLFLRIGGHFFPPCFPREAPTINAFALWFQFSGGHPFFIKPVFLLAGLLLGEFFPLFPARPQRTLESVPIGSPCRRACSLCFFFAHGVWSFFPFPRWMASSVGTILFIKARSKL